MILRVANLQHKKGLIYISHRSVRASIAQKKKCSVFLIYLSELVLHTKKECSVFLTDLSKLVLHKKGMIYISHRSVRTSIAQKKECSVFLTDLSELVLHTKKNDLYFSQICQLVLHKKGMICISHRFVS